MILKSAQLLFLVYIVSLPFVQPFHLYIFGMQLQPADIIFVAVLAALAAAVAFGRLRPVFSRYYIFAAVYWVAFLISTIFSDDRSASSIKLAGVAYLVTISIVAMKLAADLEFVRHAIGAFLVGTAVTAIASVIGAALYYAGYDTPAANFLLFRFGSLPSGGYPRVNALFTNPNMACNFLNIGAVLTFAAWRLNWIGKLKCCLLAAVTGLAVLLTISPGIGGVILSLSIWFAVSDQNALSQGSRRLILVMGIFAAVLFLAAASISLDTENTDVDLVIPVINVKVEPSVRAVVWAAAFESFVRHPVTGVGTGIDAFRVRYTVLSGERQLLTEAHNVWLNVADQAGFVGLIALILFCVYLWSATQFTVSTDDRQYVTAALSCVFVGGFLYQGLTGSFEDARHLWVVFGLMAAPRDGGSSETVAG